MREDSLICVDQGKAAGLDVLFLTEGQQAVQKLLVNLQHFHELHQSAICDVQLAVEPVSARVRLDAHLTDSRQIYRAAQPSNVLGLRAGRRKSAETDSVCVGEHNSMY